MPPLGGMEGALDVGEPQPGRDRNDPVRGADREGAAASFRYAACGEMAGIA